MPLDLLQSLTQFGVAGLMGVLWVWERLYSRRRDRQLNEAHERLMQDREHLGVLIEMVRRNTVAIERFDQTQTRLSDLLERVQHELEQRPA